MDSPARKLGKSKRKNIMRFPPTKTNGGKSILVESILESDYCLHLEFDPCVRTYFPQPKKFKIPCDGEIITYTPDFEVHYISGARSYIEVKPSKKASLENYQLIFSRFELMLQNTNFSFMVVDENDIYPEPLFSNYYKLYQYRKRPSIDMKNLRQCAAGMNISMPLSCLITTLGNRVRLREVYSWIAFGYLRFDMNSELLTMETEVLFHVD